MVFPNNLFDFSYCQSFEDKIDKLANMADDENWTRGTTKNDVLFNYIRHTYKRLSALYNNASTDEERNKWFYISADKNIACFNTGLFTKNFNKIFALFYKNSAQNKQPYWFKGFFEESSFELITISNLPEKASYFSDITEVIFDSSCTLRVNLNHILGDAENYNRIPEEYRKNRNLPTLFSGAIELAKKRIAANYNIAVPQYYEGCIQFLIPISLGEDLSHTDLVLAVSRYDRVYIGKTCLTMDMAYNNARLIAKPETPWINKTN